jgi:hypothetical protein
MMQQVFAKEIRFVRGTVVMPSIPIFTGNNKKNDITK